MTKEQAIERLEGLRAFVRDLAGDAADIQALNMARTALWERGHGRTDWTRTADALPPLHVPVLVCRSGPDGTIVEQGARLPDGWWRVYGTRTKQVTHWMALPEGPKEKPA